MSTYTCQRCGGIRDDDEFLHICNPGVDCRQCRHSSPHHTDCLHIALCERGELFSPTLPVRLYRDRIDRAKEQDGRKA